jgi:hypothetical protein
VFPIKEVCGGEGLVMPAFLLVSDHAGHNVFGPRPHSGSSAGRWVPEERLGR